MGGHTLVGNTRHLRGKPVGEKAAKALRNACSPFASASATSALGDRLSAFLLDRKGRWNRAAVINICKVQRHRVSPRSRDVCTQRI